MDIEPAEPVHTLELAEAIQWDFAGTGHELEELSTTFLVEGSDSTPEPLDLWGRCRVIVVLGSILPVIHVDFRHAGNKKFQLLFIENGNQLCWNDIMESYENC